MPKEPKRKNASRTAPLTAHGTHQRIPTADLSLTPSERRLLKDPNWMDEDEADAIEIGRQVTKEGESGTPLREYLRRNGRIVAD